MRKTRKQKTHVPVSIVIFGQAARRREASVQGPHEQRRGVRIKLPQTDLKQELTEETEGLKRPATAISSKVSERRPLVASERYAGPTIAPSCGHADRPRLGTLIGVQTLFGRSREAAALKRWVFREPASAKPPARQALAPPINNHPSPFTNHFSLLTPR
jgi:hypothetical protein